MGGKVAWDSSCVGRVLTVSAPHGGMHGQATMGSLQWHLVIWYTCSCGWVAWHSYCDCIHEKFYLFRCWNYTVFYPLKFHLILASDKHGCQGIHCSPWAGAWLLTHSHYSNSVGIEYSGDWGVAWSAAHMGAAKSMYQGGAGMGGGRARGDTLYTGCHQCTNWHE